MQEFILGLLTFNCHTLQTTDQEHLPAPRQVVDPELGEQRRVQPASGVQWTGRGDHPQLPVVEHGEVPAGCEEPFLFVFYISNCTYFRL